MAEFELAALAPASKFTGWMDVAPRTGGSGQWWQLPVLAARGNQPGPTLLVLGAVHGDEYEGVETIPLAFADVDPAALAGTLVMVPVCNLPAYETVQRSSPIDGLNLARVFPGKVDGKVTERIAYALTERLMRHADILLDLHSGGIAAEIPTLIGYLHDEGDLGQRSRAAAEAFGAPVLWGHPLPIPAGRSISAAMALGIPWLYTEAAGGGYARKDDVQCFRRGILNVMRHLGMVADSAKLSAEIGAGVQQDTLHLVGDGNLDIVTNAPVGGYFRPAVHVLDRVKQGEVLGHLLDFFGTVSATITAEMNGVVIMVRRIQRVQVGDGLVQVTNTLDDFLAKQK